MHHESRSVPTVRYGGPEAPPDKPSPESETIVESLVLLEFVADLYPEAGLLPKNPVSRAKARFFVSILNETIDSDLRAWITNGDDGSRLVQVLEKVQAMMPAEGYAVGGWSIADAAFLPFLLFAEVFLKMGLGYFVNLAHTERVKEVFVSPRFARLQKYLAKSKARSSVKAIWNEDLVAAKWRKRFEPTLP